MSAASALARLAAWAADLSSRAAFLAVNAPAVIGAYQRRPDISFGPLPSHKLDVYVPTRLETQARRMQQAAARTSASAVARATGAEGAPLVVFWHGGRWSGGSKSAYRFVGAGLAELGIVTMIPDYRHYPAVRMPGFMEDAARAVAFALAHARDYGADPSRVFVMGHSAGAHMAALVALDTRYLAQVTAGTAVAKCAEPDRIAGVIGLSGPYDFLPLREADVQDMFGPPELYPASQPINYVRADAPPMLLIHGLRDALVATQNSRSLAAALTACGVPVTLKLYDVGHADTVAALSLPARRRAPTLADVGKFVQGYP